jgi:hypothetical protein
VTGRIEHLRRIGASGGHVTFSRYGSGHMRRIGKIGFAVTAQKLGRAQAIAHIKGKGWQGRRGDDLAADLTAGRVLAALAA